jgi:hypothetical protein
MLSRLCSPSSRFPSLNFGSDIMNTSEHFSLVPPTALVDLHSRLDRALTHNDISAVAGVRTVAGWLASLESSVPVRQLQARADAAVRYMGGRSHV